MVDVDICNLALSYLGDSATVASIDPPEGSAQAQHCARFYPIAKGILLEGHPWNFITTRATLAVVQTCYRGWRFAYAVPSDASTLLSVLPGCLYPDAFAAAIANYYGREPFEFELRGQRDFLLEQISGRQVILSNAEDAVVRYSVNSATPGMFPALFTEALARLLASMLAGPILKGDAGAAEGKRQYAMYEIEAGKAKKQDANQQHYAPQPVPSGIAARA